MVGGVGSTVVMAVFELFPGTLSGASFEAVAVLLMMVPPVVPAFTLTTTVKLAVEPPAADGFLNISVPGPPAGTASVRLHPAGRVAETNVVLVGIGSLTVALIAAADELFLKPIVYVMFEPTQTGSGASVFAVISTSTASSFRIVPV